MNFDNKVYATLLATCFMNLVFAQESTNNGGGTAKGNAGSVNYSIGQAFVDTYSDKSIQITQGVQQPYEITEFSTQWLFFTARLQAGSAYLLWQINQNHNTKQFEIEKANNASGSFNQIGIVQATSTNFYQFIDTKPYFGNNYYRIKQVSNNQQFTYSDLVLLTVEYNLDSKLVIYPNPVTTQMHITFIAPSTSDYQMVLIDANGKTILSKNVRCTAGSNNIPWNVANLAAGTYFIKIVNTLYPTFPFIKTN